LRPLRADVRRDESRTRRANALAAPAPPELDGDHEDRGLCRALLHSEVLDDPALRTLVAMALVGQRCGPHYNGTMAIDDLPRPNYPGGIMKKLLAIAGALALVAASPSVFAAATAVLHHCGFC
jgi:hypothetical protein